MTVLLEIYLGVVGAGITLRAMDRAMDRAITTYLWRRSTKRAEKVLGELVREREMYRAAAPARRAN